MGQYRVQTRVVDESLQLKSFWQQRQGKLWCFLCPVCRTSRRIPCRPQPGGVRHFFQVGLTAAVFTLLCWKGLGWKGVISFLPLWTGFEVFYRWRLRAILPCRECGFDPYLFKTDVNRAKNEIETHWRKKFEEKGIPYPAPPSQVQTQTRVQSSATSLNTPPKA